MVDNFREQQLLLQVSSGRPLEKEYKIPGRIELIVILILLWDSYSKLLNNPSGLIINPSGWAGGPLASAPAPQLERGLDPGAAPHRPP